MATPIGYSWEDVWEDVWDDVWDQDPPVPLVPWPALRFVEVLDVPQAVEVLGSPQRVEVMP